MHKFLKSTGKNPTEIISTQESENNIREPRRRCSSDLPYIEEGEDINDKFGDHCHINDKNRFVA